MNERHRIAIIGAGPGGLSAGGRAAQLGVSHVVLEASPQIAKTIQQYQKGKHVMCEPGIIPLRSALEFTAGTRETVLDKWQSGMSELGVNLRFNAEVTAISSRDGEFVITLRDGGTVIAGHVILALGVQGNLRKLGIPGDDVPEVQYQLDDPDEYFNERIAVVGAGDAAIENALALAPHNDVVILNRRDEFARAKQGNLTAVTKAIEDGLLDCAYNAAPLSLTRVHADSGGRAVHRLTVETRNGAAEYDCHRIIARLGAVPPRQFMEDAGIRFPSDNPAAVPALSARYESNVAGIYVIGALAGYPLIKQCMNQGYEVVDHIEGREVVPVDQALLWNKLQNVPGARDVDDAISRIAARTPILMGLTPLQMREFLLDSDVVAVARNQVVFEKGDYTNAVYSVLAGRVGIDTNNDSAIELGAGEFFGEMSLISGRRRSATVRAVEPCVLLETSKRAMTRLINSDPAARRTIDAIFLSRSIAQFAPQLDAQTLQAVLEKASVERYTVNETLFTEGDDGDALYLIRSGSLTVSRAVNGRDVTFAYVPAGHYVGEMGLLSGAPRSSTVRAATATEVIKLTRDVFDLVLEKDPQLGDRMRAVYEQRAVDQVRRVADTSQGERFTFLIAQGVGEATDVLLIDESICVRCDHCETACAATHDGHTRLNRAAGPSYDDLHLPTSCRHCELPHCMKDCPPDAISRLPSGEVFIDDSCIGCGNCEQNCPYGVIHMTKPGQRRPSLWKQLLFGSDAADEHTGAADAAKKAVKCDMCKDLSGGPACVRACPTGAAIRISPEAFMRNIR